MHLLQILRLRNTNYSMMSGSIRKLYTDTEPKPCYRLLTARFSKTLLTFGKDVQKPPREYPRHHSHQAYHRLGYHDLEKRSLETRGS